MALRRADVLDGVIELTEDGGETVTYRAGDSFVMKPGFTGTWRTIETVRNDPTIKEHIEAAADIVAGKVEGTVGQGIDTVADKAKSVVEKVGLEPLGYVAERIGEIAKEGIEEIVEETKNKALH